MSFGKSSQSSSQEMDPQIKQSLLNVFNRGQQLSYTPYNPYQYATVAPMSPFQQAGMQATVDAANSGVGQDQMRQAIEAAQGVANYQPGLLRSMPVDQQGAVANIRARSVSESFNPGGRATVGSINTGINAGDVSSKGISADYSPTFAGTNQAQALGKFSSNVTGGVGDRITGPIKAQTAGTITAPQINAGTGVGEERLKAASFAETSMDPYMSKFQTGVIDAALGDIERQRKIQQNQNKAAAVAGGAFGGDRQAILEGETNRAALEQSARTAAQLRQSGFESAARLAEADLARQTDAARANQQAALQADLANQATGLDASKTGGQLGLQAQTAQAQLGMQGALAAQEADLRRQLANQQVSVGDAERAMQSGQINAANQMQLRDQELQRRLSNAAQANQMNQANLSAEMQGQQLRQGALMSNQDAALRAQLANQQTALAEGQARNQGLLQTQQLGAQASLANQDANLQAQALAAQQARANQSAALQASLANQQSGLSQAELDQARRIQNQQASFQRQLAQQNLGLQGAAQRLAGAQQLGQFGQDLRGMTFADAAALQGVGDTQRAFAQQMLDDQYRRYQEAQNYPFRMFDVLRSGAGMLPNPTLTSSDGSGFNFGLRTG